MALTISKDYNKHIYQGNGVTTEWPYDFELPKKAGIPDITAIKVYITSATGITQIATGLKIDPSGFVVYPYPLDNGKILTAEEKITIIREIPFTQQYLDVSNQGNVYPEVFEDAIDRLTMQTQQLKEVTERGARFPIDSAEDGQALLDSLIMARDEAVSAKEAALAAQVAAEAASGSIDTTKIEYVTNKNKPLGYAGLDADGHLLESALPAISELSPFNITARDSQGEPTAFTLNGREYTVARDAGGRLTQIQSGLTSYILQYDEIGNLMGGAYA